MADVNLICKGNVSHRGDLFHPGDTLALPKDLADRLVRLGAAEKAPVKRAAKKDGDDA